MIFWSLLKNHSKCKISKSRSSFNK